MKLPLVLLLNVLVVATGLFAYDAMTHREEGGAAKAPEADRAQLERRVAQLEKRMAERGPELRPVGTEDLAARLLELEARVDVLRRPAPRPDAPVASSDVPFEAGESEEIVDGAEEAAAVGGGTAPSLRDEDVERVRQLMDEAERRRREEFMVARLDRTLERLEMNLSEENKKRVIAASETFRDTMRSAFMQAGSSGSTDREAMASVMETARAEFSSTLQTFLPASDAEQLVEALSFGPGRLGPGGRPPRR